MKMKRKPAVTITFSQYAQLSEWMKKNKENVVAKKSTFEEIQSEVLRDLGFAVSGHAVASARQDAGIPKKTMRVSPQTLEQKVASLEARVGVLESWFEASMGKGSDLRWQQC